MSKFIGIDHIAQSVVSPISDLGVVSLIQPGPMLSWGLIMKYFPWLFSSFSWFKKGFCQLQGKVFALSTDYPGKLVVRFILNIKPQIKPNKATILQ